MIFGLMKVFYYLLESSSNPDVVVKRWWQLFCRITSNWSLNLIFFAHFPKMLCFNLRSQGTENIIQLSIDRLQFLSHRRLYENLCSACGMAFQLFIK